MIKLIWTYGIQQRGCASKSNIVLKQRDQAKISGQITPSPWFVTNKVLHNDLNIKFIDRVIKLTSVQQCLKLKDHTNYIVTSAKNKFSIDNCLDH